MGVVGTTIVAASGDGGATDSCNITTGTGIYNQNNFPGSSPYVTSLGATQGAEKGGPEIACSGATGGLITSGGGFSKYWKMPTYQESAVASYFSKLSKQPVPGFNASNRAYPDIALQGAYYNVAGEGSMFCCFYGTSASAPVFAGMVSLVNYYRKLVGKPSLGFLNPALYASDGAFTNDITVGNNRIGQCPLGFDTAPGWDPVTGFGSINFAKFKAYFASTSAPTATPTAAPWKPTVAPSAAPSKPTVTPTAAPSKPTVVPTFSPTFVPTFAPTVADFWVNGLTNQNCCLLYTSPSPRD